MSIYSKTRAELIARIERDELAARRAAAVLKDNAELQGKVSELRKALADERAKPPREVVREVPQRVEVPGPVRSVIKEVPTPCPKQAAEINALQSELHNFAKYDMDEFKKWCRMVDVARGAK